MTKQEGAHATTTEELIVQYLDGELVRNELEAVLFERLATSEEARGLLREHLVLRGAIRNAYETADFQLSSDLDARTRQRIEQMLEAMESRPVDAAPIRTNAVARRMQRWSLRPSLAMLALLLAVGGTWLLTRGTTPEVKTIAQAQPTTPASIAQQHAATVISYGSETAKPVIITRIVKVPAKHVESAPSFAQNTVQSAPAPKPAEEDPADVMLSRRYSKMINAAAKHEVVVGSRDRL
jgi:hypothetical protein